MSVEAIQYGVQHEPRVHHVYRVRCDDAPSGFIEVSKTPPSGANAMTVTIKPLYGEAFTVNVDLLREACDQALHARPERGDSWYREEHCRRAQAERGGEECNPSVDVGDAA